MDIKVELEKLTKGIYIPMVFYIPYSLLPDISDTSKKKLDEVQFFNTMGILKINEETQNLEDSISSLEILRKSNFLKSNFIQLIEFENQLSNESFLHLIHEYCNSAHAYSYVFSWMVNHIDNDIPSVKSEHKNLFLYQSEVLNQHILEVNNRFKTSKKPENLPINFKKILDNGKSFLKLNEELTTTLLQPNTTTPTKKLKDKIKLPSDADVDNMLLKQVFNVNL